MSEVSVVMQMYQSLSPEEKAAFLRMLGLPPELTEIIDSETIEAFLAKHRFPHGEVCCVHCGNIDVKKNGRTRSGHQRFYCKGCHQSFTYATKTIFGGAKRPLDTYLRYVHCMILGLTVRDSAQECHISKNTSFFLRHKILDALQEMQHKVVLDGVVEGDETYFSISFKGNHSRSKRFVMPREPHMRGERASKRGLSKEKVCVPCAVNRDGKAVARISCLGKPSVESIDLVLGRHIEPGAVFCTDNESKQDRANTLKDIVQKIMPEKMESYFHMSEDMSTDLLGRFDEDDVYNSLVTCMKYDLIQFIASI